MGKPAAPRRCLIAVSMLGNSYSLLIALEGGGLSFLKISMCLSIQAQEGTSYKGFNDSVPLSPSRKSMCLLRSVTLACNGILHISVWGQNQPLSTASLKTMMRAVRLSYRLTSSPSHAEMYPASEIFAPLRSDWPARAGTMSTVRAGSRTRWYNFVMFDLGVWRPSLIENTLVDCQVV